MSADSDMRARVGQIPPGVEFPPVDLVAAPPLAKATVAIVTTAALARPGEPWADQTHEYRLFGRDAQGLLMAHNSTNLDRSGFALDRKGTNEVTASTERQPTQHKTRANPCCKLAHCRRD